MNNIEKKNIIRHQKSGSILPQILVAAGVIAGLSLGITNMTRNINRSQESMENRFEMSVIEDEIRMAIRSRLGCRRSVGGANPVGSPGGQVNSIRDGFGNHADPGRKIISIDDVLGKTVDSTGDKNTSTPEFTVTDIRVSDYSNSGTTTSYISGSPETYDYGPAKVSVYFEKGDTSRANNEDMQSNRSYGVQSFRKDFPIRVLVDSSSQIADCYFEEDDVVENFCESLDGVFDHGLCKRIRIDEIGIDGGGSEDPSTGSVYAINSQAPMLVDSEGAVVVGDFNSASEGPTFPEASHLYIKDNASIGGSMDVGLDLLVEGDQPTPDPGQPLPVASIKGNVGIGSSAGPATSLIIAGDSGDPARPGAIVKRGSESVEVLNSATEALLIDTKSSGVDPSLNINLSSGNIDGMIEGGGSERFQVDHMGRLKIVDAGADGDFSLKIGTASSPYYKAYIRNQPTGVGAAPSYSSNWDITGTLGDEIATKKWAASSIYAHLTSGSEGVAIGNIVSIYKNNNQLDAINRHICEKSQMTITLGSGPRAQGQAIFGTYISGNCSFKARHCQSGSKRCGVLYTSGINSSGEIYTNNRVRVQSGTNRVLVRSNGTISATNSVYSSTLVRAPKLHGTGTSAYSSICSSVGCARRFGYYRCPKNTSAIGVSYGQILCGNPSATHGQGVH